jgi:hypothetical protein
MEDLLGEDKDSWAILSTGDFNHKGEITEFTGPLAKGDVVKLKVDRAKGALGFEINGDDKGWAITSEALREEELYPAVTLRDSKVMICEV